MNSSTTGLQHNKNKDIYFGRRKAVLMKLTAKEREAKNNTSRKKQADADDGEVLLFMESV